jgi:hypothetical protein
VKIIDEKLEFSKNARSRTDTGLEIVYLKTNGIITETISYDFSNAESLSTARTNSANTIDMINNKLKDNNMEIYDIEECENEETVSPMYSHNEISHAFENIPFNEKTKEKTFYKLGNNGSISFDSENKLPIPFESVPSIEKTKEKTFYKLSHNTLADNNNDNKLLRVAESVPSKEKSIEKTFNKFSNTGLVIYDIAEDENESRISYNEIDPYPGKEEDNLDHEIIKTESKDDETDDMTAKLYQIILPNGNVLNGSFIRN